MPQQPISDRRWIQRAITDGASIADIAASAEVTVSTARLWLKRHGLVIAPARPTSAELKRKYAKAGSVAAPARELTVAPETARRWLIEADVELLPRGRQRGARVVDLDVRDLRRRRERGESLRAIAAETGRDWRTIKRLLDE